MIGIAHLFRISAAASTPSMSPFSTMSINTRSGPACSATLIACSPEEAISSTSYPKFLSRASNSLAIMISSSTTSTLVRAMLCSPPFLVLKFLKSDMERSTLTSIDLHLALKLFRQVPHQLEAQRFGLLQVETLGQANPVVANGQGVHTSKGVKLDPQLPLPPTRKGVLQSIGDQFINDQAAGSSSVDAQGNVFDVGMNHYIMLVDFISTEQVCYQVTGIFIKVQPLQVFGPVEFLMDQGDGFDPALAIFQYLQGILVSHVEGLEEE